MHIYKYTCTYFHYYLTTCGARCGSFHIALALTIHSVEAGYSLYGLARSWNTGFNLGAMGNRQYQYAITIWYDFLSFYHLYASNCFHAFLYHMNLIYIYIYIYIYVFIYTLLHTLDIIYYVCERVDLFGPQSQMSPKLQADCI